MKLKTDAELVEAAKAGDASAAAELFARYWRAARATALAVTGNWATAEDAASEGFWKALTGIASLEDPGRFPSWLRTIAARSAKAHARKAMPLDEALSTEDPGEGAERSLLRRELAGIVHRALAELPEKLREAIALVYFESYAPEDAARFLGVPGGTLRRRLHDGRAQLRERVEEILNGRRRMDRSSLEQVEKLTRIIAEGKIEDAMREAFAARPPKQELLDLLRGFPRDPAVAAQLGRDVAAFLARESPRLAGNHPVAAVARAIREALPEFQEWRPDPHEAASRFFSPAPYRERLDALLPPGFAEGLPGAFARITRAVVLLDVDGRVNSVHEALQQRSEPASNFAISDALDLTWMAAGPIDLRSVQQTVERTLAAVVPGAEFCFSSYAEPRYRAAFLLELGGCRAAVGGVLREWPGRPAGMDSAHVRILLEPWASAHSGRKIDFAPR